MFKVAAACCLAACATPASPDPISQPLARTQTPAATSPPEASDEDEPATKPPKTGSTASTGSTGGSGMTGASGSVVAPGPARDVSGSRIRVISLAGADGSKQFLGFYDNMLGVRCSFQRAPDGKTRCLPATSGGFGATNYYLDASCTQLIHLYNPNAQTCPSSTGVPAPAVKGSYHAVPVVEEDQNGCSYWSSKLYEILSGPVGHTSQVYYENGGSCLSFKQDNDYLPTRLVQPSEFVEASEVIE